MPDDCAMALIDLEEAVDRAVTEAKTYGGLSNAEAAKELRRIADGWEKDA